ncbi:hypothetical protein [Streptomyces sp. NPDC050704]
MAARMATEEQQQAAAPATQADTEEVSVDAMNLLIPGLIERVEV